MVTVAMTLEEVIVAVAVAAMAEVADVGATVESVADLGEASEVAVVAATLNTRLLIPQAHFIRTLSMHVNAFKIRLTSYLLVAPLEANPSATGPNSRWRPVCFFHIGLCFRLFHAYQRCCSASVALLHFE